MNRQFFSPFVQSSYVFPFITTLKPVSSKRAVTTDLSFPKHQSVKDYVSRDIYMNTVLKVHYLNIDLITQPFRVLVCVIIFIRWIYLEVSVSCL